jgi:hypothetical protein
LNIQLLNIQLLRNDCETINRYALIAMRMCASFVQRLCNDFISMTALQLCSASFAQRLCYDPTAIVRRLRSDFVAIAQRLRSDA